MKKFILASDHAGRKEKLKAEKALQELGIPYEDFSLENNPSDDYPDFAEEVAKEVVRRKNSFGLLVCGTGMGMSIAANKIKGVRAALCSLHKDAHLARAHNDANILVLSGWHDFSVQGLKSIIKAFHDTKFEKGRHLRRLEKIKKLERKTKN